MKEQTELKVQFRDELLVWSEKSLGTNFSNLTPLQQSRQMIKFFVAEVLEKLYPGVVPDDEGEVESCIVDGSGDGGTDLLYRTDDGQVLIIQAKYRGKDAQESPAEVGRICEGRLRYCPQRIPPLTVMYSRDPLIAPSASVLAFAVFAHVGKADCALNNIIAGRNEP